MSEEATKEIPAMNNEFDTKSCVNCIHYGNNVQGIADIVCACARTYMTTMVDFKERFTFVDWESNFTSPAVSCKEFVEKYKVTDDGKFGR